MNNVIQIPWDYRVQMNTEQEKINTIKQGNNEPQKIKTINTCPLGDIILWININVLILYYCTLSKLGETIETTYART